MQLTNSDKKHIFHRLGEGTVPDRGLDAFAVGIDRVRAEIRRLLELCQDDEGLVKFLRGGYGCGKTFTARLALADAVAQGFATSFVVVSDNDFHLHKFDDIYRKVVTALATPTCPRGALADVLDRWVAQVETQLVANGADEDADDFDDKVRARLAEQLDALTRGAAPADFVRVVQTIFDLKQAGELADAAALTSWLEGSENVAASAKRRAGIKGEIGSRDALAYLRGLLAILRSAGYKGLAVVIDEAETILRMRSDVRHKSLNGIRQIVDDAASFPGLLWMFTGTPEFFDARRGVAGLEPLNDRIKFETDGRFVSLRQPQLRLEPFDAERLREVALRLRNLYPSRDPERLRERVSPEFIARLVDEVTRGFRGDVGVVPRQFLRTFVRHLNNVEDEPDYDPMAAAGFAPEDALPVEAVDGAAASEEDDDLAPVPVEDAW